MLPILLNRAASEMEDLRRLPEGGAIINVQAWDSTPRREGDESLSGWAHLDATDAAPGTVRSRLFKVPVASDISQAILVAFNEATFGPGDQPQREVSIYWILRARKFAAHLFYVVGDPKGLAYEGALEGIVRSIRPLPPAKQR